MAFFGKEYKFQKEENFAGFLKAMGAPEVKIAAISQHKPSLKLEKDGDMYIYHTMSPNLTKAIRFKSGVEAEEEIREGLTVKGTNIVDGNTLTHIIKNKDKTSTFKREFTADSVKTTITAEGWDGVAYIYHVAA